MFYNNTTYWKRFAGFVDTVKTFFVDFSKEFYNLMQRMLKAVAEFGITYTKEIVITLYITAAVAFFYINVYLLLTVALFFLTYLVNNHIKAEFAKISKDGNVVIKNHLNAVKGLDPQLLEQFSHAVYDWVREGAESSSKEVRAVRDLLRESDYTPFEIMSEPAENDLYVLCTEGKGDHNKDELIVATRGTDLKRLDATLVHDLDANCPGYSVFNKYKTNIVNKVLQKAEGKRVITLCGHSFGGAISMLLLNELLVKVQAGELDVDAINVSIYQSAGVNQGVENNIDKTISVLQQEKPDFKVTMACHLHDFDPIPASGLQVLGNYKGENAEVYMVRKHLSIWTYLLSVLLFDFSYAHRELIYTTEKTSSVLMQLAHDHSPIEYYYSGKENNPKAKRHKKKIKDAFSSTYTKFFCNGAVHRFLHTLGMNKINMLQHLVLFTVSVGVFCFNVIMFFRLAAFWRFANMYISLGPVVVTGASLNNYRASMNNKVETPATTTPTPVEAILTNHCTIS